MIFGADELANGQVTVNNELPGNQSNTSTPVARDQSKKSEETSGATVLHVGKYGRLTLAQPSLLDKENRQQSFPNA